MNIKEMKELIELINSSDLALFELKQGDLYIKMDKSLSRTEVLAKEVKDSKTTQTITESVEVKEEVVIEKVTCSDVENDVELYSITSPMVGTFYSSPAPGEASFITEGKTVKKGDILCIIEAMKLMNEIESDINGEIVSILVKDGDMVEYGQPLFKVRRV